MSQYEKDFVRRVEKVGTENFPSPGIYGSVRVTVGIDAKGDVTKIVLNSVKGDKGLGEQAIRMIRLSEPFGSFSRDLRAISDTIEISHNFTFTRGKAKVQNSE